MAKTGDMESIHEEDSKQGLANKFGKIDLKNNNSKPKVNNYINQPLGNMQTENR